MNWLFVGEAALLSQKSLQVIHLPGLTLALSYQNGVFGAIYGICPHRRVFLGEGLLEGENVHCPSHDMAFHRCTGDGDFGQIPAYEVKEEGGGVWVLVS